MKKFAISMMALLAVVSAAAQTSEVSSTVKEGKLNFEAPLFGVRVKEVKPLFSVTSFAGFKIGVGFRKDVPERMNGRGFYGSCDLVELRYRPWRDDNLFSAGITFSGESYKVRPGYMFDRSGNIVDAPGNIRELKSCASEVLWGLNLGYTRQWGRFKTGLFVTPALGYTLYRNRGTLKDTSIRLNEQLEGNQGFRLSVGAGVWYSLLGVIVEYSFGNVGPCADLPRYDRLAVSMLIRY